MKGQRAHTGPRRAYHPDVLLNSCGRRLLCVTNSSVKCWLLVYQENSNSISRKLTTCRQVRSVSISPMVMGTIRCKLFLNRVPYSMRPETIWMGDRTSFASHEPPRVERLNPELDALQPWGRGTELNIVVRCILQNRILGHRILLRRRIHRETTCAALRS